MKKFWWLFLIILLVILYLIFGRKTETKNVQQNQKITTAIVKKSEITIKLEETGEVLPVREIEQQSKVSGKIVKLYFEEGDYVHKMDVIAEIEPDYDQTYEITQKQKNLRTAEINLSNARRDYNNKKELYDKGFSSETEIDAYKDALEKAEIDYETSLLQYESIKEIETEDNLSKVYATASGTVIRKDVEEGEMVVSNTGSYSAGTVLIVLADLTKMIVSSKINEVDIGKVKMDMDVIIQVDAYPYEKYSGKITKIAPMAMLNNNVKAFPIEIEIANVDEKLKPGLTANITIIGEKRTDIVVVPIRAIFSDALGNDICYKVNNDTISTSVPVKTGINDFQNVEIISGIAEGDTISLTKPVEKDNAKADMMFEVK